MTDCKHDCVYCEGDCNCPEIEKNIAIALLDEFDRWDKKGLSKQYFRDMIAQKRKEFGLE